LNSRKSFRSRDSLFVVCMADTHRLHREVTVPDGDVLIHAGDICHLGQSTQTLIDFNRWLGDLPHSLKVCVPGNHDLPLEADPENLKLLGNAIVLVNAGIEFHGLRIWGSPVTAMSGGAFALENPPNRRRVFAQIPRDTDVLVTHEAPRGILDCAPGGVLHAGDPELIAAVNRLDLLLHVFGHHHGGFGVESRRETVFVNAALFGEDGGIDREPIVLRIPRL
jgi:Icc-related predicted phosphoesterase